jgi:hypothetical protein
MAGPIILVPKRLYPVVIWIETKETAQVFWVFLGKDDLAVLLFCRVCSSVVAGIFWQRRGPWS